MINRIIKALLISFAGLFLCLSLSSCGQTEPPKQEKSIKTLKRGNGSDPESLDPQLARSESALNIVRDLYEGLLTRNAKGDLVAGVAERWKFNPDDQCYRFYLRSEAKWSNGEKVVAQDFIRGFQYAVNIENASPYSNLLKPINNVNEILSGHLPAETIDIWSEIENELNVCMQSQAPAYALEIFALPISYPRHASAAKKQYFYNGAYYLADRVAQEAIYLKRNPYYHSDKTVYFDEVHFITTENSKSELKRFLSGELDITVTIPARDVKRLQQEYTDNIHIAPVLNTYFYGFNQSKYPFDKYAVRKALSLVVDRNIIAEKILGTGERVAETLVPPKMANYPELIHPDSLLSKEERLNLARQLYAEAGYSKNQPLKFELRYNTSPLHKKIAVALASMWKEALGAEVSLYNEEWKVFVQSRRQKQTQMFRSGWIADVNDASNYLELFTSEHPLNDYAYSNENYDLLLEEASIATSKRPSILRAAEEQLLNDYVLLPLYYYVSKHLVDSSLLGWEDNVLDIHLSRYLKK